MNVWKTVSPITEHGTDEDFNAYPANDNEDEGDTNIVVEPVFSYEVHST